MHDDLIVSYSVNFSDKTIIMNTVNETDGREGKLEFHNVLTHSFENVLDYNQILDVNESEIDSFMKDNMVELEKMKSFCWPIDYEDIQELKNYLRENHYKYIKIISSYGLCGWVLAEKFEIS